MRCVLAINRSNILFYRFACCNICLTRNEPESFGNRATGEEKRREGRILSDEKARIFLEPWNPRLSKWSFELHPPRDWTERSPWLQKICRLRPGVFRIESYATDVAIERFENSSIDQRGKKILEEKKKEKKKEEKKIHPTISNLMVIFALLTRFIVSQVQTFIQRRLLEIVLIAIADR